MPDRTRACCCAGGEPDQPLTVWVFYCCRASTISVTVTGPGGYEATDGTSTPHNLLTTCSATEMSANDSFSASSAFAFYPPVSGAYTITVTSSDEACEGVVEIVEFDPAEGLAVDVVLPVRTNMVCACCGAPVGKTICFTSSGPSTTLVYDDPAGAVVDWGPYTLQAPGWWAGTTNTDGPSACAPTVTPIIMYRCLCMPINAYQTQLFHIVSVWIPVVLVLEEDGAKLYPGGHTGWFAQFDIAQEYSEHPHSGEGEPCSALDVTFTGPTSVSPELYFSPFWSPPPPGMTGDGVFEADCSPTSQGMSSGDVTPLLTYITANFASMRVYGCADPGPMMMAPAMAAGLIGTVTTPEGPEPPLPPLATMAASFIKSTTRHLLAGSPQASPELKAARLAVCEGCEHLRASDRRCGLVNGAGCGCATPLKAARLLDECPAGKWPSNDAPAPPAPESG